MDEKTVRWIHRIAPTLARIEDEFGNRVLEEAIEDGRRRNLEQRDSEEADWRSRVLSLLSQRPDGDRLPRAELADLLGVPRNGKRSKFYRVLWDMSKEAQIRSFGRAYGGIIP